MNLLKVVNEVALRNGATYNLNTGEFNPDYGYMVSLPNHEMRVKIFDRYVLQDYVKRHIVELIKPDHYLGIWRSDAYYLDVSILVENREQAITFGKQGNQLAIWDNYNKDEISL